jgi:F-type H+-transporting ATPase subunit alpha
MKQKQYSPLSVAEMAVSIFAANEGFLKNITIAKIGDFEAALHSFMNSTHGDLMKQINKTGDYNSDIAAQLKAALENFVSTQTW